VVDTKEPKKLGDATEEVLNGEFFMKSILKADEEIESRRFKKWDEVKKDL
jgi:hypothetical protein